MKLATTSLVLLAALGGCDNSSSNPTVTCGSGTMLSDGTCVGTGSGLTCGSGTMASNGTCVPVTPATTYVQVEHLARPGINEALLITDAYMNGYNATAPTYTGVPTATLAAVVGEAKTVLKAIYLGTCLLDGVAGLTPATGLKPAGLTCHAVGAAVFEADGETQTAASITAAQTYADAVFGLFIPDVMRIDTGVDSNYQTLCGTGSVGLCGGRRLDDDVIDVTYDFLINGAQTTPGAYDQVRALVSDGVVFDTAASATNKNSRIATGDPNNHQQGHAAVADTFPYAAAPF